MATSNPARARRARRRQPGARRNGEAATRGWLSAHARCLIEALGRLHRRWLASLLTTLVIGIALALPTGLYVLVKNLDTLAGSWHRAIQISLYLSDSVSSSQGAALAGQLATDHDVASAHFISAAEGLAEFRKASGFGAALDALPENPLPGVVVITPRPELSAAAVSRLVKTLAERPEVARASLDQAWLKRLTAILSLVERAAWVVAALLAAAVLFIIGNTIRLDIENRREEIEVMKLLGASDAFIRRPFLYSGFWYGLFGSVLALLLLGACFAVLAGPLAMLTRSYDGALTVHGLSLSGVLAVIAVGIGLGWSGCALTVNRQLAAIEPR